MLFHQADRSPFLESAFFVAAGMKIYQTDYASSHGDVQKSNGMFAGTLDPRASKRDAGVEVDPERSANVAGGRFSESYGQVAASGFRPMESHRWGTGDVSPASHPSSMEKDMHGKYRGHRNQ